MLGVSAMSGIDLDRFAAMLAGTRADDAGLDDFESITLDLIHREATVAPQSLMPSVRGHLKGLRDMLVWTPPSLAPRAHSLAGQTALLAGYLLFKQDRHADADVYWTLADRFGELSGDRRLRAALLVLQAQRSDPFPDRPRSSPQGGENVPLTLALLSRAISLLGPTPDPVVAAHVLTFRARSYAEASHSDPAYSGLAMHDLEALQTHLGQMPAADTSLYIVESIRGEAVQKGAMTLVHLGRPAEAAAQLVGLLASIGQASPSWRSHVTANLAVARAAMDEPEQACELLGASLHLAGQASAPRAINRVRHARQRWLGHYDGAAALRLDDQLRALPPPPPNRAPGLSPSGYSCHVGELTET